MMDISVGAELPPFVRETGIENWNRFAAVMDEFVPIHMDDEAGRTAGFPTAIGMGNLQTSYMHNLLRGWLGDSGRIDTFTIQFQNPNLKNTTVTARGVISAVEGDSVTVDLWTEDNNDRKLATGQAKVTVKA